jgi:hypothetical protein
MEQEIEQEHACVRLNTYYATLSEFSDVYESFHAITTSPPFPLYSQTPAPAVDLAPFDTADFSLFWGTWETWGAPNQNEPLQDSLSLGLPPGNLDSTLFVENPFEGLESSPPSSYPESRAATPYIIMQAYSNLCSQEAGTIAPYLVILIPSRSKTSMNEKTRCR